MSTVDIEKNPHNKKVEKKIKKPIKSATDKDKRLFSKIRKAVKESK